MITVLQRGGYAQMIKILHRGGDGSLGTPKSDYGICARPLTNGIEFMTQRKLSLFSES